MLVRFRHHLGARAGRQRRQPGSRTPGCRSRTGKSTTRSGSSTASRTTSWQVPVFPAWRWPWCTEVRLCTQKDSGFASWVRAPTVDADTVFQLASVSKSVGATVVAHEVGIGTVDWDTPVISKLPGFALADPWVTDHLTISDLYTHRSGLPDHAGDGLEDLGYNRAQVLENFANYRSIPSESHTSTRTSASLPVRRPLRPRRAPIGKRCRRTRSTVRSV